MKVLILDDVTTQICSMVYSQSQILEEQGDHLAELVFHFELGLVNFSFSLFGREIRRKA